jgi:hypothetical protein
MASRPVEPFEIVFTGTVDDGLRTRIETISAPHATIKDVQIEEVKHQGCGYVCYHKATKVGNISYKLLIQVCGDPEECLADKETYPEGADYEVRVTGLVTYQ